MIVFGSKICNIYSIESKVMDFKKNSFTLIEMLMGIAIGGIALVGMFSATMSYMKIWKIISAEENNENFNREVVTRRLLSNELSTLLLGLDRLEGNQSLTFRKLNGTQAIYGADDVYLYWESPNQLPFLEEDKGGITQCWLKFEGTVSSRTKNEPPRELRLYYRSLKPGDRSDFSGGKGAEKYFTLLKKCKGINFGYTDFLTKTPDIQYFSTPKFSDGANPDLPEVIQILLADDSAI
ncbi:MAG: prepilin-type N-terminal cleavage/methylation domain-containing protein [Puniceicoccales bacterium]|jgi:prepilin-type N-terminal cleavage/methylation domain-containing protein|nr:prepilin-type N-terminal cleavage/methylation domain-containing protein [Puniceicoccales bacterium]